MKKITVAEAATAMGVSQQFVRIGLQREILPFGCAVRGFIPNAKFYRSDLLLGKVC